MKPCLEMRGKLNKKTDNYDFTIDFQDTPNEDTIKILEPYFIDSSEDDNLFWFGYFFSSLVDSELEEQFVKFINDVKYPRWEDPDDEWSMYFEKGGITSEDLNSLVAHLLSYAKLRYYDVDVVVCPNDKGKLVRSIGSDVRRLLDVPRTIDSEIVLDHMHLADKLRFDVDKCIDDIESSKIRTPRYVTREYLDQLNHNVETAESFSMRQIVYPPVLRRYVIGTCRIPLVSPLAVAESIVIVNDLAPSNSSTQQIIDSIRQVNSKAMIYVLTLFEKQTI